MNKLDIDLNTVSDYISKKLKTYDIKIHAARTNKKHKTGMRLTIAGKKYYLNINTDNDLYLQWAVMKKMESLVPKVIFCDQSKKIFPYNIMLTCYIEGAPLSAKIIKNEPVDYCTIGKSIQKLHCLPSIPGLQTINTVKTIRKRILKRIPQIKDQFPSLSRDVFFNLKPPLLPDSESNLVISHNDLHGNNILLNEKSLSLIDFDTVGYSSREYDLAQLFAEPGFAYNAHAKVQAYLLDYIRKKPAHIIDHKQKILSQCANIANYDFSPSYAVKLNDEAQNHILRGYNHPVSKSLLSYFGRMIRLENLIKTLSALKGSTGGREKQFNKLLFIVNFIQCDTIPFSNSTTQDMLRYIRTL